MFGKNEIVGRRYFNDAKPNELMVTSMFMTIQGEGPLSGMPAFFIRLTKCNLACSFCFVGPTKISMGNGRQKPIKDVQVGEEVVTWDEKKQEFTKSVVTQKFESNVDTLVQIKTGSKMVTTTPEHPFLVKHKGWVKAKDLKTDDVLLEYSVSDRMKMPERIKHARKESDVREGVESIEVISKHNPEQFGAWCRYAKSKTSDTKVYNIEVEGTHTYVANGLIVHNCDAFFDDGDYMSFEEIMEKIDEKILDYFNGNPPDYARLDAHGRYQMVLVMTGGEPMLQKNLGEFLSYAGHFFAETQIESNGIFAPDSLPDETIVVVSPKCFEKEGVAVRYIKPNLDTLNRADCLKFLVEDKEGSPYFDIPDWAKEWGREHGNRKVYISPINVYNDLPREVKTAAKFPKNRKEMNERSTIDETVSFWEEGLLNLDANKANHEYAARFCINNGFKLNLQQHLYASLP